MSLLHAYFNLRRQNDFQRCLEQSKTSSSGSTGPQLSSGSGSGPGSRSWTKNSSFSNPMIDVNSRDWLGRTILHLACSAIDPAALEYTRLLLGHPHINVNIQDQESLWSPLHRALYSGNIPAAALLLQRSEIDMFIKDAEGYTAFDLYNSTVAGTNPAETLDYRSTSELYTWGSNRNAALGMEDGGDRTLPEQVVVRTANTARNPSSNDLLNALKPLSVVDVAMSKLHTIIITGEERGNIRSCGFSSSGRLGPGASNAFHTQFSLRNPQEALPHKITTVALGQDHTLAVTSNGEAFSWGLNRFHQLGYVFEGKSTNQEDQIQAPARKITGPLRNLVIVGVACCKTASVCWTSTQLFSWGTNNGQLGYEKTGLPQTIPRLVSYVSEPVLGVAMTDSAMLILLKSRDVICIHDGNYWKLQFPAQRGVRAYRLPAKEKHEIRKVTACEGSVGTFAIISEAGDVYLLNTEEAQAPRKDASKDAAARRPIPHLVWAVRKQFTAVKDVALGADGSMVLCTKSGHVFVRSRVLRSGIGLGSSTLVNPPKNAPIFKFHRVPNLQRITKVCANSTGAFAALRLDATPVPINLDGQGLADDLDRIQPFRSWARLFSTGNLAAEFTGDDQETIEKSNTLIGDDDDATDISIAPDIRAAMELCHFLTHLPSAMQREAGQYTLQPLSAHYGADTLLNVGAQSIPIHKAVLLARAPAVHDLLSGRCLSGSDTTPAPLKVSLEGTTSQRRNGPFTIQVKGCSPMTILVLCYYLYTDQLVTVWDRRVALAICSRYGELNIDVLSVKAELRLLASQRCLRLHNLEVATSFIGKAPLVPTLVGNLKQVFNGIEIPHDVVLHLSDKAVKAHSFVLRCRSIYFSTFFDEPCWTQRRFKPDEGVIEIDLKEFNSLPMFYLFRYLYGDVTPDLFDNLDFIKTSEQYVDFMFDVIACSNHFLLDRLTDFCSAKILRFVDLHNVSSVLVDASHLNATALVKSLHGYITENLETLMEMRALEELPQDVLKAFSSFLRNQQAAFHPHIRGGGSISALEQKWANWAQLQDFPAPFAPKHLSSQPRIISMPASHPMSHDPLANPASPSTPRWRVPAKTDRLHGEEDIFPMDSDAPAGKSPASATPLQHPQPNSPATSRVWKSTVPSDRVDMRTIMETERQASDAKRQAPPSGSPSDGAFSKRWPNTTSTERYLATSKDQVPSGVLSGSPPLRRSATTTPVASSSSPLRISSLSAQRKPHSSAAEFGDPSSRSLLAFNQASSTAPSSPLDTRALSISGSVKPIDAPKKPSLPKGKAPTGSSSNLGPLIVPVKHSAALGPPARRSVSGDSLVWSNHRPTPAPPISSSGLSFASIQQQQATKPPVLGPPKSLREIQDEEQEVAFLMWFEEESARLRKQEEDALSASLPSAQSQDRSGQNKRAGQAKRGRGGRERGRGRGRGQGQGRAIPEVPAQTVV